MADLKLIERPICRAELVAAALIDDRLKNHVNAILLLIILDKFDNVVVLQTLVHADLLVGIAITAVVVDGGTIDNLHMEDLIIRNARTLLDGPPMRGPNDAGVLRKIVVVDE